MNFSSLIGVALGVLVMYESLSATASDLRMFLDFHGILIVCGGTLAAASISFPVTRVLMLLKVFLLRVLGRRKVNFQAIIAQFLELNKRASGGLSGLKESLPQIKH